MLLNNSFVHCDWFNKKADWPIVKQDKVRQESQIVNAQKKGRARSCQPEAEGAEDECAMLVKVIPHGRV